MKCISAIICLSLLFLLHSVDPAFGQPAPNCISNKDFYGVSVSHLTGDGLVDGPGYVYRQDPKIDRVSQQLIFEIPYRGFSIVQLDTFATDSWSPFNVRSRLVPLSELQPDFFNEYPEPYNFTEMSFRGGFWRHFILEPRQPDLHVWDLEISDGAADPFCKLRFLVRINYGDLQ